MKGDIAFVGFMLTADEWHALDAESRAQLIAVATRRIDTSVERPRRFPDGTGKHAALPVANAPLDRDALELADAELVDAELVEDDLLELDGGEPNVEPASTSSVDERWEELADLNDG